MTAKNTENEITKTRKSMKNTQSEFPISSQILKGRGNIGVHSNLANMYTTIILYNYHVAFELWGEGIEMVPWLLIITVA